MERIWYSHLLLSYRSPNSHTFFPPSLFPNSKPLPRPPLSLSSSLPIGWNTNTHINASFSSFTIHRSSTLNSPRWFEKLVTRLMKKSFGRVCFLFSLLFFSFFFSPFFSSTTFQVYFHFIHPYALSLSLTYLPPSLASEFSYIFHILVLHTSYSWALFVLHPLLLFPLSSSNFFWVHLLSFILPSFFLGIYLHCLLFTLSFCPTHHPSRRSLACLFLLATFLLQKPEKTDLFALCAFRVSPAAIVPQELESTL